MHKINTVAEKNKRQFEEAKLEYRDFSHIYVGCDTQGNSKVTLFGSSFEEIEAEAHERSCGGYYDKDYSESEKLDDLTGCYYSCYEDENEVKVKFDQPWEYTKRELQAQGLDHDTLCKLTWEGINEGLTEDKTLELLEDQIQQEVESYFENFLEGNYHLGFRQLTMEEDKHIAEAMDKARQSMRITASCLVNDTYAGSRLQEEMDR